MLYQLSYASPNSSQPSGSGRACALETEGYKQNISTRGGGEQCVFRMSGYRASDFSKRSMTLSDETGCRPVHDPQEPPRKLIARQRARDADGMAELYETGAVFDIGDSQQAVGREPIRGFYAKLVATGMKFSPEDQRPTLISGGIALISTLLPNGSVTAEVARRQTDGTWLREIDQPSIARGEMRQGIHSIRMIMSSDLWEYAL